MVNKIANVKKSYDGRIMKVSKSSEQSNSETVTTEHDKEISKERYIYLENKDRKLLMI